ncbi:MAG: ABC transporter permease subunit [Thermoplasmatales archaeon]
MNVIFLFSKKYTSSLSFKYYGEIFSNSYYIHSFYDSIILGIVSTLTSMLIALPIAYGFSRTTMKLKNPIRTLLMTGLAVPSFIITYDLIIFTTEMYHLSFTIYSMVGLIIVMTISFVPFMVMYSVLAFDQIDYRLIEAAKANGAPNWYISLRITFPLLLQGLYSGIIVVFLLSIGSLSVPLLLAPTSFPILTSSAYTELFSYSNFGLSTAMLTLLLLVSFAAIILYTVATRKSYATVGGKGFHTKLNDNKIVTFGLTIYSFLVALLPVMEVFILAMTAFSSRWVGTFFPTSYTLSNFSTAFSIYPHSLYSTLILVSVSTIAAVGTSFGAVYGSRIHMILGKRVTDVMVLLIFSLSNVVIGLSYLVFFSNTYTGFLVTTIPFAVIMGYTFARIGYSFRAVSVNMDTLSNSLLEAGMVMAPNKSSYFSKVVTPMIIPGLIEGFLVVFVRSSIDYGSTIFLAPYNWTTLSLASFSYISTGELALGASVALIILAITIPITVVLYFIRGKNFEIMH